MPKGAVSVLGCTSGTTPHMTTARRVCRRCASRNAAPKNTGSASTTSAGCAVWAAMIVSYCVATALIITVSVRTPATKLPLTAGVMVPVRSPMVTVPVKPATVAFDTSCAVIVIGKGTPAVWGLVMAEKAK